MICGTARVAILFAILVAGSGCSFDALRPARAFYIDSRVVDDGGDGTRERPWRSLNALQRVNLRPGDTILFARGSEFEGGFQISQSGSASAPITIKSTGDGPRPRFHNPTTQALAGNGIRIDARHVIVEDLFFTECPQNPVDADVRTLGAIYLTRRAEHCVVRNCEMTRTPVGVTVYGEHNLIQGNRIHDNNKPIKPHWGPMGIVICGSHNEVAHNRIENLSALSDEYGHDGGAIEINDRALPKRDIYIHHNVSLRNQGFIEFVGRVKQDDIRIEHNVCMDYQSFLGLTGPVTNLIAEHNTVVRTLAHDPADSEDVIFWNYDTSDAPGGGPNENIVFRNNVFIYDGSRVEPVFSRGQFEHSSNVFYRTDESSIPTQANRAAYQRKYLGGGAVLRQNDRIGTADDLRAALEAAR